MNVLPIGAVEPELVDWIAACIAEAFELPVSVLDPMREPPAAFDSRRGQYNSVVMLQAVDGAAAGCAGTVLGVTERDLFIPMLSFVLGQAQLNGRLAIVSMARLRQEFYGLPPDAAVLRSRARAETLHELGHAFGLIHCADATCTMSLSTTIVQVDRKLKGYCASCRRLIGERRAARAYDHENELENPRR